MFFQAAYRRLWLPPLLVFLLPAFLSIVVFRLFPGLDLWLQSFFYQAGQPELWPLGKQCPSDFLYRYAAWPAGLAISAAIFLLLAAFFIKPWQRFRIYSVFLILSMLLGPGLLINSTLKMYWGRPRPREIKQFNGNWQYLPLWQKGESGRGKSFPCGHCASGFFFFSFYFIFSRKNRRLARLFFGAALAYGLLIGYARMAAGGHFPSDIVWSGLLVFLVAWLLYYLLLQIPLREDGLFSASRQKTALVTTTGLFLAGSSVFLLTTPFYTDIDLQSQQNSRASEVEILCQRCNLQIDFSENGSDFRARGEAQGFGFPGSRLVANLAQNPKNEKQIYRFQLQEKGFFTFVDTDLHVSLQPASLQLLKISIKEGDIIISPRPQGSYPFRLQIDQKKGKTNLPAGLEPG